MLPFYLINKFLPLKRKLQSLYLHRAGQIVPHLTPFITKSDRVLDLGCGTGSIIKLIKISTHCQATLVDVQYNAMCDQYPVLIYDGQKLPFDDNVFDLVMSGGSTAFINNIPQAIKEYARVTKPWGFIGDVNFFYHTLPPKKLISDLNNMMNINIQPWDETYWLQQYQKADLEMYYHTIGKTNPASDEQVIEYCRKLIDQKDWNFEVRKVALDRLVEIMNLFNENHRYLSYGVFITRKQMVKHDTLF